MYFKVRYEAEVEVLELRSTRYRSTVGSVAIPEPHSDTRSFHVFQSVGLRSIFHVKVGWPGLVVIVRSHHHRCNASIDARVADSGTRYLG